MTLAYICPLCSQALSHEHKVLFCKNNHRYDIAKEGYVNLLPVQNKKSKVPGDSVEMVKARRSFLELGHYQFLQQAIANKLAGIEKNQTIIDLGCGEGFYTQALKKASPDSQVYGVDISKPAIKYAAKRYIDCHFSVASIANSPFEAKQADIIVSIFAPLFDNELKRLCKNTLITASPGPSHLFELKNMIYSDVKLHTNIDCPDGFVVKSTEILTQVITLDPDPLANLIMMTPFAWKFRPEHWQKIKELTTLDVTLEFYLNVFSKI